MQSPRRTPRQVKSKARSEVFMLLHEKANQAQSLLSETGLGCWFTFSRETGIHPDPGMEQVVGAEVVRNSAFIFGAGGMRVAIVANFDVGVVRSKGVFNEVIGYDEDIRESLLGVLRRLDPKTIGLNFSPDDQTADGLTHGQWLLLQDLLRDTPFAGRLTSAAPLLGRLRGRKSLTEINRIRSAIAVTEEIVGLVEAKIRPGVTEKELGDFIHCEFDSRRLATAWAREACPIVNSGPASDFGHGIPSPKIRIEPGHILHIDLGVRMDGYCSDLQRLWYIKRPGETAPPAKVQKAFATAVRAVDAAAAALKPGVRGFEIDAIARQIVVDSGYPEYKHALGHSLGRAVHDGGTLLGPRWPCYGKTSEGVVEKGNVFTLEPAILTEAGMIGLEEDVVVTDSGCEFLSTFKRDLTLI
jgi:Xaa-Pro aminopeptidase